MTHIWTIDKLDPDKFFSATSTVEVAASPWLSSASCIYLSGDGEFHGLDAVHAFQGGAFLVFPGLKIANIRKIIKSYDGDKENKRINAQIVSVPTFLESKRMPDGSAVDIAAIPAQDEPLGNFYKPRPLNGFWEWLPEMRDVERQWIRTVEEVFERYGFANIETPAVEEVAVLTAKGEGSDKKMYNVQPSQGNEEDAKLGLHYDLTVPMARYVAQHYQHLNFPFKRYQIQKAWRGDRPKMEKGRGREFTQCDIDVVDRGSISLEFDAELPIILSRLTRELDIGDIVISINNRKIFQGFYQGLGLSDNQIVEAIRIVDKLDIEGVEGVGKRLSEELKLPAPLVDKSLALASIRGASADMTERVLSLGVDNSLLRQGLTELDFVMDRLVVLPKGSVQADLSIARGLDYYTGTIYEGKFAEYPDYPTILAGGRYDNLVGNFMKQSLPGVGISFGLTRIFSKLHAEGRLPTGKKTPTEVLVAVPSQADISIARNITDGLRERHVRTEMYHEAGRLDRQLDYANKKGIPFVLFPDIHLPDQPQVRDMRSATQMRLSSLLDWSPK